MHFIVFRKSSRSKTVLFAVVCLFALSIVFTGPVLPAAGEQDCKGGRKVEIGTSISDRLRGLKPRRFQFGVTERWRYHIFSQLDDLGACDLKLYDSSCRVLDESAAFLRKELNPGTYYISVTGLTEADDGEYRLFVIRDPSGHVALPYSTSYLMRAEQSADFSFNAEVAGFYTMVANSSAPRVTASLFSYANENYKEIVPWREGYKFRYSRYLQPGNYHFYINALDETNAGQVAVRMEGPIQGVALTGYVKSLSEEIKKSHDVDLDAYLAAGPGQLPDGLGTLRLGQVQGKLTDDWKRVLERETIVTWEHKYEDGNVAHLTLDQTGKTWGMAYSWLNKPGNFRDDLLSYLLARFGDHFKSQRREKSSLTYLFNQTDLDKGVAKSLRLTTLLNNAVLEVFHDTRFLQQKTTQGNRKTSKKDGAKQTSTYERLHEWFGKPTSGLPRGIGSIQCGNQFNPGETWKLVKTEGDKKFYQYKFESGNWNVVEVDSRGKVCSVEVRIVSSTPEFVAKLKDYCLERFGEYLKSDIDAGANFIYRFHEGGYGLVSGVSMELIGAGPRNSYTVWLYKGELKKY